MRFEMKKLLIIAFLWLSAFAGCVSYRYTGFDSAPEDFCSNERLVVTRLAILGDIDSSFANIMLNYKIASIMQATISFDNTEIIDRINRKLAEKAVIDACEVPITVVVGPANAEVDLRRMFFNDLLFGLTWSIVPEERLVDERCNVFVYAEGMEWKSSLYVRGEVKWSTYFPSGLIIPDVPENAVHTRADRLVFSPASLLLTPKIDVFADDLADVIINACYGKTK